MKQHSGMTIAGELAVFFANSRDLLAIVDHRGYFTLVNPACERVLGFTEMELYARPVTEFLHPDDVVRTQEGIADLIAGNSHTEFRNRYLCKNGVYKWLSWSTTPMGSFFYTVGRDISDQVNSEEHIRDLNLKLAQLNADLEAKVEQRVMELRQTEAQVLQLQKMDAIGRLAGGIAHDFNNMLAVMTMSCDLLHDDALNPEAVLEHVQVIREVTDRASALTRQLLIFSRKQIIQPETISLNPIILNLEKMLTRLIGENIKIHLKLSPDLRMISGDPSQMEQVILNLVVNAKDAMPQGGHIILETSNLFLDETFTSKHLSIERGEYVLFTVTDAGSGMDAETAAQIFEPFFTTKPAGKGTGLGLTTTYGIVKQSKGTIWVYSEPGIGTTFKIYLPISEKRVSDRRKIPVHIPVKGGHETILLVEDDKSLRTAFHTMLARKGYNVLVSANGTEALQVCEIHKGHIDLLLTDVMMPDFNGFDLARKILAMRSILRVIYMSGYTDDALHKSGIAQPELLDFIQKPFGINVLVTKVQEVLMRG